MVVKIQKMFVWMCVFCKFIATANKAFTNGKILRKTVYDKNIATGNNYVSLEIFDQNSTPRFFQDFYEVGTKTQAKTLNILQFLSFSNVGQLVDRLKMPFEK